MSLFGYRQHRTFECHFCCKTTTTPSLYKSGWFCPNPLCAQYNGFTANGDYNLNINELPQNNQSHPSSYCKPSNLPFEHITNNVFRSNAHFTPNTFIATSCDAPLCRKCNENQQIIQRKLSNFDAGVNSDYSAYTQYRQLLADKYPICNHCLSQCGYRMNTINHNARLWQNYEDSLPEPDLTAFIMKSDDIKYINYCCSSLVGCIIHSLMIYVSFMVSIIGLSTQCDLYLNTPFDLIESKKCDIGIGYTRCHDVDGYWIQCLYIHSIKNEYLMFDSVVCCIALLLLVFVSYAFDAKKPNHFCYFLWIFVLLISIGMSCSEMLYLKQINIGIQMVMFIFCVLFMMRKPMQIQENIHLNDALQLLEQQEIAERRNDLMKRSKWNVNNGRKGMNSFYGLNVEHTDDNNEGYGVRPEPMDICNSPGYNSSNIEHNFNSLRNGIHSLDLNRSF